MNSNTTRRPVNQTVPLPPRQIGFAEAHSIPVRRVAPRAPQPISVGRIVRDEPPPIPVGPSCRLALIFGPTSQAASGCGAERRFAGSTADLGVAAATPYHAVKPLDEPAAPIGATPSAT